MSSKPNGTIKKAPADVAHPGMMGDGTEEQSLNERGDPAARITKADLDAAFAVKIKPKTDAKR
ncbi:hypothetical protein [Ancylobacter lacus]|uniref:hypothetical protein n=1 Tax=Ancylobacter lacus TaxID=2579970 RepID=UPI001BCA7658|nr:hypothetical protein [Ancylobacter lacus]MBS7541171.1 hypothetical protein [Ancylobacter lacus]